MGIHNLNKIIEKYAQSAIIKDTNLNIFSGKIIAIDASIYLYKFSYNDNYMNGIITQVMRLLKNNITPFYIFDGKPPKEKMATIKERKEKKEIANDKILYIKSIIDETHIKIENNEIDDNERNVLSEYINTLNIDLHKTTKSNITISRKDIEIATNILAALGIPYAIADGEAEVLCAELSKCNIVSGILSDDTDVLANGGKLFIRNFSSDKNIVSVCYLDKLLEILDLEYDEFIDMCILCGCDYTTTIPGIGHTNSYKLISKYKTIEQIIDNHINKSTKYIVPADFDYIGARALFKKCNNIDKYKDIKIRPNSIDHIIKTLTDNGVKGKHIINVSRYYLKYVNILNLDLNKINKKSTQLSMDLFIK